MDTAPWLQEMALVKPPPMEDQLVTSTTTTINNNNNNMMSSNTKAQQMMERKATRPQKDQTLACPRCNSTNTKFCYYNNYSLTQPRYFCKSCRRYWTEGGSLRNVPVGGGSRKNKRSSSASAAASMPLTPPNPNPNPNPNKFVEGGQDLNLAFAHQTLPEFRDFNPNHNSSSSNMILPTGGINPNHNPNPNPNPNRFGPFTTMMPAAYSSSGFSLQQDFRPPALNFPLDGINGGYDHQNGGRILFDHQSRVQGGDHPPVFWNGMIGGQGGSW